MVWPTRRDSSSVAKPKSYVKLVSIIELEFKTKKHALAKGTMARNETRSRCQIAKHSHTSTKDIHTKMIISPCLAKCIAH